ncbi:hypothetical protein [Limosilactobacillus equigenerosi]|uniref:Uncharacterized protein n=1 Tax=Limosilactobacillus equigenerosi DSM 18793 = JCM 14505 TaxID=1423742 RepID=A0A0R1UYQ4_9LACO|nr:hypothetical protein [Limosilactobacillus equigenerosi]KRL96264.1 hypothetical protein FC21_GL000261 [Limosilactobacillus equigenerosi DSM 18793 = JCM 14505]
MKLKERRFPYPVLSMATSDYPLGNFTYDVEVVDDSYLHIVCNLQEKIIEKYINRGDFMYVVGIESVQTKSRQLYKQSTPEFKIELDADQLGPKLHLNVLILANRDVTNYPTNQLNSVYHGRKVSFKKGYYIAKCPTQTIEFEFENEVRKSGIIVKENPNVDSFTVDVDQEVISISLNSENYEGYKKYRKTKRSEILNSIFYTAVMAAITQIVMSDKDYSEAEDGWIPLVTKNMDKLGYTLEDLKEDASLIVNVVNAILKNPLNQLFDTFNENEE